MSGLGEHRFDVGALVRFIRVNDGEAIRPRGVCEVIRLMPATQDGGPQYQLKCSDDGLIRVASEKQLTKA